MLAVQAALAALGLDPGTEDATFGGRTRRAVMAFQRDHGLHADGVVGAETASALSEMLAAGVEADEVRVRAGLRAAVEAGRLTSDDASADRTVLARVVDGEAQAGIGPAALIAGALSDVADQAGDYDTTRAHTLFAILALNVDVSRASATGAFHPPASAPDADGVVYRYYPGHGFQFHPLASFGHLNVDVNRHLTAEARRLAEAMVARAVKVTDSLRWEYYFAFGGPGRWTSGFAQAVAADALARAARLVHDPRLARAARSAFVAVRSAYLIPAGGGLWIREYSFSDMLVLNAQLQTIVSLWDYAKTSDDAEAWDTVAQLEAAARTLLPRFDLGCWSRYSLGGSAATPSYHAYHIRLLRLLTRLTRDPSWADTAGRWQRGLRGTVSCSHT